jgi:hypothetical protein
MATRSVSPVVLFVLREVAPSNPSLQPTRYSWLRQLPHAAELKR